jgi:hypothetical protein
MARTWVGGQGAVVRPAILISRDHGVRTGIVVGGSETDRPLGWIFVFGSISLLILFSYDLIRAWAGVGIGLEALWNLSTPAIINDVVLILASLSGLVSACLRLRNRDNWARWGVLALLGLAVGFALVSWHTVHTEGLLGTTFSPRLRWVSFSEQAAFWCWIGFSVSIFWWNRPRWKLAGATLLVAFCLLGTGSILAWAANTYWPFPTGSPYYLVMDEEVEPVARAAMYMLLLFLVFVLLRGAVTLSRSDLGGLSSWVLYVGSLSPLLILLGWLGLQWIGPSRGLHPWILWFAAIACLVSIAASLRPIEPGVGGRRASLLAGASALSLLSPLLLAGMMLAATDLSFIDPFGTARIAPQTSRNLTLGFTLGLAVACSAASVSVFSLIRKLRGGVPPEERQGKTSATGPIAGFPLALSGALLFLPAFPMIIIASQVTPSTWLLAIALASLVALAACIVALGNVGSLMGRAAAGGDP